MEEFERVKQEERAAEEAKRIAEEKRKEAEAFAKMEELKRKTLEEEAKKKAAEEARRREEEAARAEKLKKQKQAMEKFEEERRLKMMSEVERNAYLKMKEEERLAREAAEAAEREAKEAAERAIREKQEAEERAIRAQKEVEERAARLRAAAAEAEQLRLRQEAEAEAEARRIAKVAAETVERAMAEESARQSLPPKDEPLAGLNFSASTLQSAPSRTGTVPRAGTWKATPRAWKGGGSGAGDRRPAKETATCSSGSQRRRVSLQHPVAASLEPFPHCCPPSYPSATFFLSTCIAEPLNVISDLNGSLFLVLFRPLFCPTPTLSPTRFLFFTLSVPFQSCVALHDCSVTIESCTCLARALLAAAAQHPQHSLQPQSRSHGKVCVMCVYFTFFPPLVMF
ncbi:hypothetical protein DFJ73DRAFT_96972 [Zopfochytrium polystomum]|nr:hypothetical protein DFJ73DRAFT_96972 [Zopfochytrium polystomum]